MCLKFEMCCYSGALHYQFGSHKAIYKINISLTKKKTFLADETFNDVTRKLSMLDNFHFCRSTRCYYNNEYV